MDSRLEYRLVWGCNPQVFQIFSIFKFCHGEIIQLFVTLLFKSLIDKMIQCSRAELAYLIDSDGLSEHITSGPGSLQIHTSTDALSQLISK